MGISAYLQWLKKRYPDAFLTEEQFLLLKGSFLSISIDGPGLLHKSKETALSRHKKSSTLEKVENDMIQQFNTDIVDLISHIENKDSKEVYDEKIGRAIKIPGRMFETLIFALDGLVPLAKIQQQRQRRFRSAKMMQSIRDRSFDYDSNRITAGSEFVKRVGESVGSLFRSGDKRLPSRIFYSSDQVPGEGEHKIFATLSREYEGKDLKGIHVIHGLDNDLIMLSLLSPVDGIYLYKEGSGLKEPFVNIDQLRRSLFEDLKKGVPKHEDDPELYIDDFIVFSFLLGNDFVPTSPMMTDRIIAGDLLMTTYQKFDLPLVTIQGEGDEDEYRVFEYQNFADFVLALTDNGAKEEEILRNQAREFGLQEFGTPESHRSRDFYKNFRKRWYHTVFNFAGEDLTESSVRAREIVDLIYDPKFNENPNLLIRPYYKIIAWTYYYYRYGSEGVDWNFFYPYWWAPLLTDLGNGYYYKLSLARNFTDADLHAPDQKDGYNPGLGMDDRVNEQLTAYESPSYEPIHQLMAVIPKSSSGIIPEELRFLTNFMSDIFWLYPDDYKFWNASARKEEHRLPMIPMADMQAIFDAVERTDYPVYEPKKEIRLVGEERRPRQPSTTERGRGRGGREQSSRGRGGGFRGSSPTAPPPGRGRGSRGTGESRGVRGTRGGSRGGDTSTRGRGTSSGFSSGFEAMLNQIERETRQTPVSRGGRGGRGGKPLSTGKIRTGPPGSASDSK
jgi:hypothetical protein